MTAPTPSELLGRGYSVIPLRADKKPFFSWKEFQTRRADTDELKRWQSMNPAPAAYAVVTGQISGIVTFDFDGEKGVRLAGQCPRSIPGATAALESAGLGACAKIAAQLRNAVAPSHKSLARIDVFTVEASLSDCRRQEIDSSALDVHRGRAAHETFVAFLPGETK